MATRKVTAAPTRFRVGQQVTMAAAPHRRGTIVAVTGSGVNALYTVNFPGWHAAVFRAGQLA